MSKFIVNRKDIHHKRVEVEASSPEEALRLVVQEGEGTEIGDPDAHQETMEVSHHSVDLDVCRVEKHADCFFVKANIQLLIAVPNSEFLPKAWVEDAISALLSGNAPEWLADWQYHLKRNGTHEEIVKISKEKAEKEFPDWQNE